MKSIKSIVGVVTLTTLMFLGQTTTVEASEIEPEIEPGFTESVTFDLDNPEEQSELIYNENNEPIIITLEEETIPEEELESEMSTYATKWPIGSYNRVVKGKSVTTTMTARFKGKITSSNVTMTSISEGDMQSLVYTHLSDKYTILNGNTATGKLSYVYGRYTAKSTTYIGGTHNVDLQLLIRKDRSIDIQVRGL